MTDEEIGREWGRQRNRRPRFNARTLMFEWLQAGSPTSAVLPADVEAWSEGELFRALGRVVREADTGLCRGWSAVMKVIGPANDTLAEWAG